jgi:hypothetical protein
MPATGTLGRDARRLLLLSWKQVAHPYLDPADLGGRRRGPACRDLGVAMVMVAGESCPRRALHTDRSRGGARGAGRLLRVDLKPEEERRRSLSREIFPVVKRFYEGWLDEDARQPFYRPSSRT